MHTYTCFCVQFIIYILGNMLDTIGIKVKIFKLTDKDFISLQKA